MPGETPLLIMMTTPTGPTHTCRSLYAGRSPQPRSQAVPGVVAHFLDPFKIATLAGPPTDQCDSGPAPNAQAPPRSTPTRSLRRDVGGADPSAPVFERHAAIDERRASHPPNNASRRRPAGPMNADPRQEDQTVLHPKNFQSRSTASKIGLSTVAPRASPTVCCRVPHRIFLTPRLSCGARMPPPSTRGPPARRQLQPVVTELRIKNRSYASIAACHDRSAAKSTWRSDASVPSRC